MDVGLSTLYIAVVGPMLGVLPSFTVGTGATFASEIILDDWPFGSIARTCPIWEDLTRNVEELQEHGRAPCFCLVNLSKISMGWSQPEKVAIPKRRFS